MPACDPRSIASTLSSLVTERPNLNLFAILDAARSGEILAGLGRPDNGALCLLEGEVPPVLAEAAPYLVQLGPRSPVLDWLLRQGWGKSWGIFVVCAGSAVSVRSHFRQLLMVRTEEGTPLFFRYYDPRVLRVYLPTCTVQELAQFFGKIRYLLVEQEDGEGALAFSRFSGQLFCQEILFEWSRPPVVARTPEELSYLDALRAHLLDQQQQIRQDLARLRRSLDEPGVGERSRAAPGQEEHHLRLTRDAAVSRLDEAEQDLARLRGEESNVVEQLGRASMEVFRVTHENRMSRKELEEAVLQARERLQRLDGVDQTGAARAASILQKAEKRLHAPQEAEARKEELVRSFDSLKQRREEAEQAVTAARQELERITGELEAARRPERPAAPASAHPAVDPGELELLLCGPATLEETGPPMPCAADFLAEMAFLGRQIDELAARQVELEALRSRVRLHQGELEALDVRLREAIFRFNSSQSKFAPGGGRDEGRDRLKEIIRDLKQQSRTADESCANLAALWSEQEREVSLRAHDCDEALRSMVRRWQRRVLRVEQAPRQV